MARVDMDDMPVWGGWLIHQMPEPYRNQVRAIVAAPSGAAARRFLEAGTGRAVSRTFWSQQWCDTGNDLELLVARTAGEGVVLYRTDPGGYPHARAAGLSATWLPWWADWPTPPATD